ncbi:MAG TPA: hypothetical protein VF219_04695 [Vicinamibacterales bacterium]
MGLRSVPKKTRTVAVFGDPVGGLGLAADVESEGGLACVGGDVDGADGAGVGGGAGGGDPTDTSGTFGEIAFGLREATSQKGTDAMRMAKTTIAVVAGHVALAV